jgi:hypothetical protein
VPTDDKSSAWVFVEIIRRRVPNLACGFVVSSIMASVCAETVRFILAAGDRILDPAFPK